MSAARQHADFGIVAGHPIMDEFGGSCLTEQKVVDRKDEPDLFVAASESDMRDPAANLELGRIVDPIHFFHTPSSTLREGKGATAKVKGKRFVAVKDELIGARA